MLATLRPCEIINEFVKFSFVRFRFFNRALCLEQDNRFEVNPIFCRDLLLVLVENQRLYDAVFFLKVGPNNLDILGVAVISELTAGHTCIIPCCGIYRRGRCVCNLG